ncbi:probable inactive serine/threonine-protein kinase slob2 [Scylla paramamosain]|uniref:probable inactive serine/threonine-protein kinase slob2 n=1 Tax=Scylla paramamosain TaxID=85552 RepID=UPI003082CD6E
MVGQKRFALREVREERGEEGVREEGLDRGKEDEGIDKDEDGRGGQQIGEIVYASEALTVTLPLGVKEEDITNSKRKARGTQTSSTPALTSNLVQGYPGEGRRENKDHNTIMRPCSSSTSPASVTCPAPPPPAAPDTTTDRCAPHPPTPQLSPSPPPVRERDDFCPSTRRAREQGTTQPCGRIAGKWRPDSKAEDSKAPCITSKILAWRPILASS